MPVTDPVTVVFVNPSRSWGGAEKSSFSIAYHLSRRTPYRVHYLTGMPLSAIPPMFAKSGIEIKKLDTSPWFPLRKPSYLFRDLAHLKKALASLLDTDPGTPVFIGIMHYASFLLSALKSFSGKPYGLISSPRGPLTPFIKHMVKDPLERVGISFATRFFCHHSDLVVTPSTGTWKDLVKNFGAPTSRGRVIPNFVEIPPHAETVDLMLPSRPRICWTGRLDRERNFEQLFEAFLEVSKSTTGSLIIVGDGPLKGPLQERTKKEGLDSRVFFAGFRENVFPFLFASDIFVHTCLFDGCPNSLLEACAAGLPVIAQNCPYGPTEILDSGKYGILYNTKEDLEYALKELLTDAGLRRKLADLARKRASHYSVEKTLSGYESVIDEVVRGHGNRSSKPL